MRLSRVTSSSMSVTAALTSSFDTSGRRRRMQRRFDDHQRIADLVCDDRRKPPQRREPFALRGLALESRNGAGHRVEGRRQQPRIFVLPPRPGDSGIRRVRSPVAAMSRIAAVTAPSGRVTVRAMP